MYHTHGSSASSGSADYDSYHGHGYPYDYAGIMLPMGGYASIMPKSRAEFELHDRWLEIIRKSYSLSLQSPNR